LADGEEQGQISWLAEVPRILIACLVELCELVNDLFGEADATEPAGRDSVAGSDQSYRLARGYDLAGLTRPRGWNDCRCAHLVTPLELYSRSRGSLLSISAA
jgi:hypothetical protein